MSKPFNHTPEGTYCISGGDTWERTSAKTLRGAMRIATHTFQVCVGGKIEVGITTGFEETFQVIDVAVKHGYDDWVKF